MIARPNLKNMGYTIIYPCDRLNRSILELSNRSIEFTNSFYVSKAYRKK
jgi:hypothetical protein